MSLRNFLQLFDPQMQFLAYCLRCFFLFGLDDVLFRTGVDMVPSNGTVQALNAELAGATVLPAWQMSVRAEEKCDCTTKKILIGDMEDRIYLGDRHPLRLSHPSYR
jgi:hypothetical protein